ncbi:MAG: thiamine pyrophosphate-dependent enzyme [Aliishimia sp.]
MDRTEIVEANFRRRVLAEDLPIGNAPTPGLNADTALDVFRAQVLSRCLDLTSRDMQKRGQGFYTIGSSGHEGMAAVAAALRVDDIAFLHYRDAAFQIARGQVSGITPLPQMMRDMLLSFACAADDPISGGRHKVLGAKALFIPPQTSTIASHLPKAMGAAYGVGLARRVVPEHRTLPDDGIAVVSFGDASLNHSTAQGTINAAGWSSVQGAPLPLLMVCEDNGIGISTKSPEGWVEASMCHRPGVKYFKADGLDLYESFAVAQDAAHYVRTRRKPAFLHLRTVRLYGHAGPDVVTAYLSKTEVEADEANDPLLQSVRLLRDAGVATSNDLLEMYEQTRADVIASLQDIEQRPHLQTAAEVMTAIIPPNRDCVLRNGPSATDRADVFGADMSAMSNPQPMSKIINMAMTDLMLEHPELVQMGEDIGRKGGNYGVTQKLLGRFGPTRMVDTLLDEQSILGLAIGMAHNGFLAMPEIQFLAYLHNAEDQLRGEAATLPFFSQGQWTNPMVLRISSLGYQKGFGGHFHNDNSLAVLRDIPGLVIACPSRGDDAARMLREAVRLAREEQRVVVFVEPIALYPMRDFVETGDGGWMSQYPAPSERIELGEIGVHGDGTDLAIVTYGNGRYLSCQAQADLAADGVNVRVIDLRWLAPLPEAAVLEAVAGCDAVLIVDECRKTGGQAEGLMTLMAENGVRRVAREVAVDSFIATGPAYGVTMPSRKSIASAARALLD